MKIRRVAVNYSMRRRGRTDEKDSQADMNNLIVIFHSFANAPKK